MAEKTVTVSTVSQHTEVSTTRSTSATLHSGGTRPSITCDTGYLRSVQGMTKIAEFVISLTAFCVMVSNEVYFNGMYFFDVVAIIATVVSLLVLILRTTHLHLRISLPWNIIFVVLHAVMALLFFAAFIVGAVYSQFAKEGAATTLGFFATTAYVASFIFAVMDWRLYRRMIHQTQGPGTTGTYTGHQAENPALQEVPY